jgi:hypothetical protein
MKPKLLSFVIILSLIFSFSGINSPVEAEFTPPSPDLDQDGLSNVLETMGWYNLSGGPYQTDPNMADTDQDGLTDAEEKLFDTDPTDSTSPGIAVKYEDSFQTFEYYRTSDPDYLRMVQGGDQHLLTEAMVVRRGTTFKIAAVSSSTATLTISGSGLTSIIPVRDPAYGGWNVTIPPSGTVGTYTATITDGAWSRNMLIYVIFELPTGMTQEQIEAYLYDDDPQNQRDEVAVWWRVRDWQYYNDDSEIPTPCEESDPICSNWKYHVNFGYAQAFWTEQFTKKVLIDFTMPVIQGKTNTLAATQSIVIQADKSTRVNYPSTKNSFSSATTYYIDIHQPEGKIYGMTGGACETNSGVFTSMLRSVGIAARMFNLDYNKVVNQHGELGNTGIYEYDHAVMMWAKGQSDSTYIWYAGRTAITAEDEYQFTPEWVGSSPPPPIRPFANVGIYDPIHPSNQFAKFQDIYADLIQSTNEGWDFQNGSLGGGMVNTVWGALGVPSEEFNNPANPSDPYLNRDYKWDSQRPLSMNYQSPYMDIFNCQLWNGDTWAPSEWQDPPISNPEGRNARRTYLLPAGIPNASDPLENWPYNPKPDFCSPSAAGTEDCTEFLASWQAACTSLPGQASFSSQTPALQTAQLPAVTSNTSIQIGEIISDAGVDYDKDGRFERLIVTFEITSDLAGEYQLGGWLKTGDQQIRAETSKVTLISGKQLVEIAFDGQAIGDNQIDGPYQIEAIWVAPADQAISEPVLLDEMAAYSTNLYTTQAYQANNFTVRAAYIANDFSYSADSKNTNGVIDSITISVPLDIALPGTFTVEGDLFDGLGEFVGHAEWTGSNSAALLKYAIARTQPPYSLEHLNLFDKRGKALDSRYAPVYTIDDLPGEIENSNITLSSNATLPTPKTIIPTSPFAAATLDTNANGRIDQLVVSTTVDVSVAGSYWMEGLLVGEYNRTAAWSVGTPQNLTASAGQTIQMAFDAQMLYDHLPVIGTQNFTLIAVHLFSGDPDNPVFETAVPIPGFDTAAYSRAQLEPSAPGYAVFEDDIESGPTNWDKETPSQWSLTNNIKTSRSGSNSWIANGSASNSGLLSFATPLDLSGFVNPWLRFNTAHKLSAAQSVLLEISTNGVDWTTLETYTGSTTYWSAEMIDLSAYETDNVMIRFNAQNYSGLVWIIDDVFVYGGPSIQSASFTHSTPVEAMTAITFTAAYVSVDMTLPITYTWDFCGVTEETSSPTIVHTFTEVGDCQVGVTVDNFYDSASATPQTISVTPPTIQSVTFTYTSPVQALGNTTFTASYVSSNMTIPVTYTWDFCGVTKETTNPSIIYKFTEVGNCLVTVTVDNSFVSATSAPQTLQVAEPDPDNLPKIYLPLLLKN